MTQMIGWPTIFSHAGEVVLYPNEVIVASTEGLHDVLTVSEMEKVIKENKDRKKLQAN